MARKKWYKYWSLAIQASAWARTLTSMSTKGCMFIWRLRCPNKIIVTNSRSLYDKIWVDFLRLIMQCVLIILRRAAWQPPKARQPLLLSHPYNISQHCCRKSWASKTSTLDSSSRHNRMNKMLGLIRFRHLNMKTAVPTHSQCGRGIRMSLLGWIKTRCIMYAFVW